MNMNEFETMLRTTGEDGLNLIIEMVNVERKNRRNVKNTVAKSTFKIGDEVEFNAGPRRGSRRGFIVKINQKKIQVDTGGSIWNCPPSMLSIVG